LIAIVIAVLALIIGIIMFYIYRKRKISRNACKDKDMTKNLFPEKKVDIFKY
jgi:cell division protein FtsN